MAFLNEVMIIKNAEIGNVAVFTKTSDLSDTPTWSNRHKTQGSDTSSLTFPWEYLSHFINNKSRWTEINIKTILIGKGRWRFHSAKCSQNTVHKEMSWMMNDLPSFLGKGYSEESLTHNYVNLRLDQFAIKLSSVTNLLKIFPIPVTTTWTACSLF